MWDTAYARIRRMACMAYSHTDTCSVARERYGVLHLRDPGILDVEMRHRTGHDPGDLRMEDGPEYRSCASRYTPLNA